MKECTDNWKFLRKFYIILGSSILYMTNGVLRNMIRPLREGPNESEDDKCTAASAHHSVAHVGNCFGLVPAPHVHGQLHTDGLQQDKVAEEGKIIVETGNYRTYREGALSRTHQYWIFSQNLVYKKKLG